MYYGKVSAIEQPLLLRFGCVVSVMARRRVTWFALANWIKAMAILGSCKLKCFGCEMQPIWYVDSKTFKFLWWSKMAYRLE